jgi:hypothetical protein
MEIARVKAELASLSGTSEHEESSSKRRKPAAPAVAAVQTPTPTHAPAPQPAELDAVRCKSNQKCCVVFFSNVF